MEDKDPALEKIIDLGALKYSGVTNDKKVRLPAFVRTPTPTSFKTTLAQQNYWAEEKRRWVEGYGNKETGSWICGMYYHYMQEQWIKDRYEGGTFRPEYRLQDHLVFNQFDKSRSKGRHTLWLKGKGAGASCIAGAILNHTVRAYPGTTGLYTANNHSSITNFFMEKVMPPFNNYHDDIKPVPGNLNKSSSSVYLRANVPVIVDGVTRMSEGQIVLRETSQTPDSPKNLSGHGAKVLIVDEIMIHPRRAAVIKSAIENLRNATTGKFTGWMLGCGTIEEMSNEQLSEIYALVLDAEQYKFDIIFTPFWMNKYCTNGYPDKKRAIKEWEEELELKEKGQDPTSAIAFRKINPKSLEDILALARSGRWNSDVADIIKVHTQTMNANPPHEDRVKLTNMGDRIEKTGHPEGRFWILEGPKAGVKYYHLTDHAATGTETGATKGSKTAGMIIKGYDPETAINAGCVPNFSPVCIYFDRPPNIEHSFRQLENQIRYYDQFAQYSGKDKTAGIVEIFAEANTNFDSYVTFLKKVDLFKLAGHRRDFSGKNNIDTKKVFQQRDDHGKIFQYEQANIFLRKYITSIRMSLLLKDMNKPPSENVDVLDAWLVWFFLFPAGEYDKPPKAPKPKVQREVRRYDPVSGTFKFMYV